MIATKEFLTLVVASHLLSQDQLQQLQAALTKSKPANAAEAAKVLLRGGWLTRWQAEQLLAGRKDFFLGKYKLLEQIGKGGMGAVFKAMHTVMERQVALKVMAQALLNNPDAVARFRREVRSAAALKHPNIVAAYDADSVGNVHFLVMEFVEGKDLKQCLTEQGPLPVDWTCEVIRQAALGLQHAHEHQMVHRDIKPSNLLVTQEGPQGRPVVKILDMGLARLVSETKLEDDITQSGQIVGTPDYIAPEQAIDSKTADIRADIFSLGCTLYQLLTGRPPFGGDTIMAKLMARTKDEAPPLRKLRAEAPESLEAVVARMLALDPARRPQTPAEVALALAPFSHGESVSVLEVPREQASAAAGPSTSSTGLQAAATVDPALNDFFQNLASRVEADTPTSGMASTIRPASREPPKSAAPPPPSLPAADKTPVSKQRVLLAGGAALLLVVMVAGLMWAMRSADPTPLVSKDAAATNDRGNVTESEKAPPGGTESARPAAVAASSIAGSAPANLPRALPERPDLEPAAGTPKPPTPGADPPEPAKPAAASTNPPPALPVEATAPAPPSQPQTLVVGPAADQLPDLAAALAKARAGDTILIRHRGPLELDPIDLTGKTPLTIAGDREGEQDFWPIVRQRLPSKATQTSASPGLFFGSQLQVTLKRLHLAVGGSGRPLVKAVFSTDSGRVRLEQCSVTIGVQGDPGAPAGPAVPLVKGMESASPGQAPSALAVEMDRCFLRGVRLEGCLDAGAYLDLRVDAQHTIWAGGAAPWIAARHVGRLTAEIRHCTLYNIRNLLMCEPLASVDSGGRRARRCCWKNRFA